MDVLTEFARFLDPIALLLVIGGALAAAVLRSTREDVAAAFRALAPLVHERPEADARAAMAAVNAIEAIAQAKSIACVDRVATAGVFLRRAAFRLSDAAHAAAFTRWADEELAARRRRHAGACGFWQAVADAAPAMGMIGTIIGLVRMFAAMDDTAAIGPAMALAMLTTLYGIILSSAVAGPIAARLERLSTAELAWQSWTLRRFTALIEAEPDVLPYRARPALRTVS
jgi:chemotaxis protein MotA